MILVDYLHCRWLFRFAGGSLVVFTCLALATAAPAQDLKVRQVASGLTNPIYATAAPGDTGRLFIVEQGAGGDASIKILNLGNNTLEATPFLTLTGIATGGESGLLGMAFDPNYATNGRFYLNYTDGSGDTRIDRFTVSGNPNVANTTATNLLTIDQPQSNHNGGWIGFSPRAGDAGNLYIATGDGGGSFDQGSGHIEPGGNAQSLDSLLGKILRINVATPAPGAEYSIPAGNPFGDEIFALGLRNPFRASFDQVSGNMFIGDVGQGAFEEIDVQKLLNGGENFGWRLFEGSEPTDGGNPPVGGAAPSGYVGPILDYDRDVGRTVIGGYVYRGGQIADLYGKYIFGDFLGPNGGGGTGRIFSLDYDGTTASNFTDITNDLFDGTGFALGNVYSFAEDANKELYIIDGTGGAVYLVVPEPATGLMMLAGVGVVAVALFRGARGSRARSPGSAPTT
ncbi:MAG: PQQ-dependent sugar dehydrogenase [Pirellulales bacterium]